MPNYVNVNADELEIGMDITAWRLPDGNSGQGGTVVALGPGVVKLVAGTPPTEHVIAFAKTHHFTVEKMLDAEECIAFHTGECQGDVDYRYAPSRSNIPRCVFHNDQRWDEYQRDERSVARYADSDVAPPWFDESAIGEHFGSDY